MIIAMKLSRITAICLCLISLTLWLAIACSAPTQSPTTPSPEPGARLYTRTPTPTVTPTPTPDPKVLYQQGLSQRDAWDLETALNRFDAVLEVAPNAATYASRAEVYRLLGRYEQAAADIESALALDPQLPEAWRQMALLSRAEATWDEALTAVNKLIELEPANGSAYVLRAEVYDEGFGKIDLALADYERAISYNPSFDKATRVERWRILAKLGNWQKALHVSRKMAASGSEDPARYFYLAWSLTQLGRVDDAIQILFFGIRRYPDYPVMFYYALGVAYYEREAWTETIQALEVALLQLGAPPSENAPERPLEITDADILGRLGIAYLSLKQCETGAAIVERAIAESPDPNPWLWAAERIEECYISITPTPTPEDTPAP